MENEDLLTDDLFDDGTYDREGAYHRDTLWNASVLSAPSVSS